MGSPGPALLFPGQGAQAPGMGRELVREGRGRELLEQARDSGLELERLLLEGSPEELRPTQVAQPALYFTGVTLGRLLLELGVEPAAAAGHSLGEYCAVVLAGALSAEQGMGLVLERGRLMAEAPEGTMAAVLGLRRELLEAVCAEAGAAPECCVVANDNAPGQLVVSGSRQGVERASALALERGARKVVPLRVGGAFHSPLMAEAARAFARLVDGLEIGEPAFPVGAGLSGGLSRSGAEIRAALRGQLEGPVRWTGVTGALAGLRPSAYLECGPGTTLSGLLRRIVPGAEAVGLDSPAAVRAWVAGSGEARPASGGASSPRLQ